LTTFPKREGLPNPEAALELALPLKEPPEAPQGQSPLEAFELSLLPAMREPPGFLWGPELVLG